MLRKNAFIYHGGARGSGAKRGNKNTLKHGFTTAEAKVFRKTIRFVIKESRERVTGLNPLISLK